MTVVSWVALEIERYGDIIVVNITNKVQSGRESAVIVLKTPSHYCLCLWLCQPLMTLVRDLTAFSSTRRPILQGYPRDTKELGGGGGRNSSFKPFSNRIQGLLNLLLSLIWSLVLRMPFFLVELHTSAGTTGEKVKSEQLIPRPWNDVLRPLPADSSQPTAPYPLTPPPARSALL